MNDVIVLYCSSNNSLIKDRRKHSNNGIDFTQLVDHFINVQDKHKQQKIASRTVILLEKGVKNIEI